MDRTTPLHGPRILAKARLNLVANDADETTAASDPAAIAA
jgi:hypothetical protein